MKTIIVLALLCSIFILNCTPVMPEVINQPPVAYIDSISSYTEVIGTPIRFVGHGTDPEGVIVAYEWRSDIDGIIGKSSEIEISTLSLGKHTIYFRVQDAKGLWSKEVYDYVNIRSPYTDVPVINVFEVQPEKVNIGSSVTIKWDVSNAQQVTIMPNLGNVASSGTRIIIPDIDTTYKIVATNNAGSTTKEIKVTVLTSIINTIELISIAAEDGSVRQDTIIYSEPNVGMFGSGLCQAFLSFDISMIPQNAVIKDVKLDLSNYNVVGYPFSVLGLLGIFNDQYGTLTSNRYVSIFPGNPLYLVPTLPSQPYSSTMITNAVQQQVSRGSSRFQIRLQFQKSFYDGGKGHYLTFDSGYTKLIISYEIK